MTRRQNWVVISFFLILIFGFTIATIVLPDKEFSEKENRVLTQFPKLSLESVLDRSFENEYETYLADQFVGRNEWIGAKTKIERMSGKQETNGVYFAEDGYLIEKHSGIFTKNTARSNVTYLADFLQQAKERYGSDHVKALMVPNAVEVLKEKLPPFADSTEESAYLEELREALPEDTYVDVKQVLEAHQEEEIFYRTDHHWKTLGARYAYLAWAESIGLKALPDEEYEVRELADDFYGTIDAKVNTKVVPDTIEAYVPVKEVPYELTYNHSEKRDTLYDESYLKGRDKYAVFFGGNQPLIEARTQAESERKLLVFKDSYANCFLCFAMQDFSEIDIVDLRYFNEDLAEFVKSGEYTDILVLYNLAGFAEDTSIGKLQMAFPS